jgi:8-oxo-dGTP diphosphatase
MLDVVRLTHDQRATMAKERLSSAPPPGAWAIIHCTRTDKYLLGKRSHAVNNAGAWNLFGGRIDRGEGPVRGLLRELAEEAGLRIKPKALRRVSKILHRDSKNRELHYFLLEVDDELAPRLNREHSRYGWFHRRRLPSKFNLPTSIAVERGLLR